MRVRFAPPAAVMIVLALAVASPVPVHAAGAAPAPPVLLGPSNGSAAAPGSLLSVSVSDPDDANVQVTFRGAAREGAVPPAGPAPFTFLVLPDTQNYVITPTNTPVMTTQMQWISHNSAALNLAFVAGVGDIVDNYTSAAQWTRASTNMAVLDDARVPYSIVPGNHDFDIATGDFSGYDTYFPVSRFKTAAWNSPAASYGGHMGDGSVGTDIVNRQNMNNFSLFSAGGMGFLVLGVELNPPDHVIEWAQRVIAQHPDRRVILATHSYVNVAGALSTQVLRTDVPGNSGADVWSKLVYPNCSVFLVVNGHFTNGLDGEANRTDVNSCGQVVNSALSDFQGRPNGGDGWLRYYTFNPGRNEIQATTYSPSLLQFENDADSSFVMSYAMTPPPSLPVIGTKTVPSGSVASIELPNHPPGTVFDWYATVGDGSSEVRGSTQSVTVSEPAGSGSLAADGFARSSTSGWGVADSGGSWTVNSTAKFSVASGAGRVAANAGSTLIAGLESIPSAATDTQVTVALSKIPNQYANFTLVGRAVGSSLYGARLRVNSNGTAQLQAVRDSVALGGAILPGLSLNPNARLRIRTQVEGFSPTTIRVKAWLDGTTEPVAWHYTTTDSAGSLQTAGAIRISTYVSSSTTNGPITTSYDDLAVTTIGGPAPANVPPAASFTWSASGLTVTADSSTSSDADGLIVSRAWDFGGTPGGSGTTATRTYPSGGTYPVTLTVTDDDGAAHSSTQSVTVTQPPTPGLLASDGFARSASSGWSAADTGGSWTVNSAAKFSVAGGTGNVAANSGSTLNASLASLSSAATDSSVTVALNKIPDQYVSLSLAGRVVGAALYGARLRVNPNGTVLLQAVRDAVALGGTTVAGLTVTPGTKIRVRAQVQGTSPTTIRVKVWVAGAAEPSAWHYVATDSTAVLQAAGGIRISTYLSSSATNGPLAVAYDNLTVTSIP